MSRCLRPTSASKGRRVLSIKELDVRYGNVRAVNGISLEAKEGDITVILGVNGAGKTSTLRAIMGLAPIRTGEIVLEGTPISGKAPHQIASRGIALCPEGRQLFPAMTVSENLSMGAFSRNDEEQIVEDREHVLERFPRLRERGKQRAGTLSGGEQQMLAIARALMARPKTLLLDEPTWGLAPMIVQEVADIIQQINDEGTTVLLVEQNTNVALQIGDYAYVLETGSIEMEGAAEELREDDHIKNVYLGGD